MNYLPQTFPRWLLTSMVVVWTLGVMFNWGGGGVTPTQSMGAADALVACQSAIRRVAYDPEKANVPAVPAVHASDHYRFEWNQSTRMVRLRNRAGLDGAVTASCAVEPKSRRFLHLIVDDQSVR